MARPTYILGLDLAQAADYTAIAVLECRQVPDEPPLDDWGHEIDVPIEYHYHLRHLERLQRVPYPKIVAHVGKLLASGPLRGWATLVVDGTGIGAAVVDLFREAELEPHPIIITGGDNVTHEGGTYRVPKRDLVGVLQVALQTGRLKIAKELPLADVLVRELLDFRMKINIKTGHDSYEAWRENAHDDLVLAASLACWWGEAGPGEFGPLDAEISDLLLNGRSWVA